MTIVKDIINHFSDYPVFTYRDLKLYFSDRKMKAANLSRLLSYMKSTGKLYLLRKGVYTFREDDMVSGFSYNPFYYGMLSALTVRELWTQNSHPDIITIRKVRASSAYIFGDVKDRISVHHIPARYFFGFDIIKYGTLNIPVSDPEKTLIDLFYYKVRLPVQNYSGLLGSVNVKKLRGYLKAYDMHTVTTVLNFVKRYKNLADSGKLRSHY